MTALYCACGNVATRDAIDNDGSLYLICEACRSGCGYEYCTACDCWFNAAEHKCKAKRPA